MGRACIPILFLDNDPVRRNYAARVAENDGYLATEVAHAGEAFDALGANPQIKAVVTAHQWETGIDGIALAGTITCYWPNAAVVLLAERVLPSDADLPLGTVVLPTPFTPHQLLAAIGSAIEARCNAGPLSAGQLDGQQTLRQLAH